MVCNSPASRLLQACRTGGVTLHGTGVHPTFMVERVAMTMARALSEVTHVRCVEAVDFAAAPGSMWGGLRRIGFGSDPAELGAGKPLALFGDLYYGDLAGNVAHHLFGAGTDEVRVEHDLRGLSARERFQTRSGFTVEPGQTAALHMTHRGYLGDHHFFTNEECWYLGEANAYRGDDLPYPDRDGPSPIDYTIEITGAPAALRTRLTFALAPGSANPDRTNPVTGASVRAILDALPAVCAAEPGILIEDPRPHYVHDDRIRL
jgi:4-hydroxy-tetrahydrodipicolinate reductase